MSRGGVSSGNFSPRSCSKKKAAEKYMERLDDVIVIDDDDANDSLSDVVFIDISDELEEPTAGKRHSDFLFEDVISIDDDDESNVSNRPEIGVQGIGDLDSDATSKKAPYSEDNYYSWFAQWFRPSGFQFTREKGNATKSDKCRGTFKSGNCGNRYGLYYEPASSSSDSEFSDCDIMEDTSGDIREQWQQASLKRKNPVGSNDWGSASCSMYDTQKNVETEKSAQHPEATTCSNSSKSSCDKGKSAAFAETPDDDFGASFLDSGRQTHVDFDPKNDGFHFSQFQSAHSGDMHTCRNKNHGPFEEERENSGHERGGNTFNCSEGKPNPEGSSHRSIHNQDAYASSSYRTATLDKESKYTKQAHQSDLKSQLDTDFEKFPGKDGEKGIFCRTKHMNKTTVDCASVLFTNIEATSSVASHCFFSNSQPKSRHTISKNADKAVPEESFVSRSFHSERAQANYSDAYEKFRGNKESSFVTNPSFDNAEISCPDAHLEVNRIYPSDKANDSRTILDKCSDKEILHADSNGITISAGVDMIINREKLKETDEFKQAMEAEWVSRQEQLRIQAEEAQRLRKRKRAENLRLFEMERRQKQRLEEIRETQKKDEENMNLKEQLRGVVRKELHMLELKSYDMASLLRSLGIHVGGGVSPSSQEVHAAYKRALLKFHPDRATRGDIRQQVEAEEKFKLIARMKEKFF